MKRGGPLKRYTPLQSKTGIKRSQTRVNPVSDRRRAENRLRRDVVAVMRDQQPWCHAKVVPECTNQPDDAHELLSRARGGSITDPENIILVCRADHEWITTHPAEAEALGLARKTGLDGGPQG